MNYNIPILIIDDEQDALDSLDFMLASEGFKEIYLCNSSLDAINMIEEHNPQIILTDIIMPNKSGEELLNEFNTKYPNIITIVATGQNDIELIVRCIRNMAFDFIVKPIKKDILLSALKRATEICELRNENKRLNKSITASKLKNPKLISNIVTVNSVMLSIFKYCEIVAETNYPVLITGETGTGKELIAKLLHKQSKRSGKLISVNTAGLDIQMFSDTLFGHIKGAFTGALTNRKGLIEEAEGGTLFLDEISNLSEECQIKLLRFIQENEYSVLGSDKIKKASVRLIVATNKQLDTLKDFRQDLYFRLNTHEINLPPLRERKDDISNLLDFFIEKSAKNMNKKKPSYPPELIHLLKTYNYPGNIRELESMICNAVSLHSSKIMSMDIFNDYICNARKTNFKMGKTDIIPTQIIYPEILPTLKEASKELVKEAMKRSDENIRIASNMLGISPQALHKRIKS